MSEKIDVAVVGGGHNGLIAACYLAKAGLRVRLFEATDHLGGATSSERVFEGIDANLSRYSYLVSLLPDQIIADLDLEFETIRRRISSFTPFISANGGNLSLLISNDPREAKAAFHELGLQSEYEAWHSFYQEIAEVAPRIAATFLSPLPTPSQMQELIGLKAFEMLFTRPLGETLSERFSHDHVRGIVLTDGLIGTFTDPLDPSLLANRCFLYHVVGNGDGAWKVPRGGMGALISTLRTRAISLGVSIETGRSVEAIEPGVVRFSDGQIEARFVVAAISPRELTRISGSRLQSSLTEGAQVKINMVLTRLPRLRSGADPKEAFAGTFHIDESFEDLQKAYREASAGELPERIPAEIYCHTLTDPSILSSDLARAGYQTLTLFALHTPYQLFRHDNEGMKLLARTRLLRQLNEYLLDPIEECLAFDSHGDLAIEVKSPLDLEREINLPEGNIFHADLTFPWREDHEKIRWGSETDLENVYIAGAGSRRGGGVSGIGGHNAAMAILEKISQLAGG